MGRAADQTSPNQIALRAGMPHPWCKSNLLAWSIRQDGYDLLSDARTVGEITFR